MGDLENPSLAKTVNLSEPADPRASCVRELLFVDCDELSSMVSGGDVSFIQLSAGPSMASMRRVDFKGFFLMHTCTQGRMANHAVSREGIRVVRIPLRWTGSLHWNGIATERPGVIVWGDSCDSYRVGSDVRVATLVIDESMLREQVELWAPSSQAAWDSFHGQMLNDTAAARRFLGQVEEVLALAATAPEGFRFPAIRTQLREQLLLGLVEAVEAQGEIASMESPTARHRSRIVGRLTDYLQAHPEGIIGLSDLCGLTGCGARSLNYTCQTILGISPMRYLKLLRLNRARALLREGSGKTMTVSQCAYAVGFAHLGRFSAEYREMFGESPKETLNRS